MDVDHLYIPQNLKGGGEDLVDEDQQLGSQEETYFLWSILQLVFYQLKQRYLPANLTTRPITC